MKKLFFQNSAKFIAPLLILLFFVPNLLLGRIPFPADTLVGLYHPFRDNSYLGYNQYKYPIYNPLIADPVLQTYPWRQITIDNFKKLNLPLWNPYNFSGQSHIANIQAGHFQIFNIFFFILPFNLAWTLQVIAPLMLGSIIMYLFLKNIKLSIYPAIFGALTFSFSGFFVSWLEWGTIITTAIWLPAILLSIGQILNKKKPKLYFTLLSLAVFQLLVSGHLQTALYSLLAITLYLVFNLKLITKRSFILLVCGFSIGFLLSAPQILPTLELVNFSSREIDQTFTEGRKDWFIPYENLTQLVAPDYLGNHTRNNYWGIFHYGEFVSYAGIFSLFFSLICLTGFKNKYPIFLLGLSLIFAIKNPLSTFLYDLSLPIFSSMQPSRLIFLLGFSLSMMAAIGLETFISSKTKSKYYPHASFLFILVIILAAVAKVRPEMYPQVGDISASLVSLRNSFIPLILTFFLLAVLVAHRLLKVPTRILILIIFVAAFVDFYRFSTRYNTFTKTDIIFPPTEITSYLQKQQKPFRVMTTDRRVMHPNINSAYKIESVDGYDPLYTKNYADFVTWWQQEKFAETSSFNRMIIASNYSSNVTNLMNVKYVLSLDELKNDKLEKILEEGQTKLYENKNYLSRAFVVDEIKKVQTDQELAASLSDTSINLAKTAFSKNRDFKSSTVNSSLEIIEYKENSLRLAAKLDHEAPVLVSNTYYPGWKAKVDGQNVPIEVVNHSLMSAIVPGGEHTVEFKFESKSFYNGLCLALTAVVFYCCAMIFLWKRKFQL